MRFDGKIGAMKNGVREFNLKAATEEGEVVGEEMTRREVMVVFFWRAR